MIKIKSSFLVLKCKQKNSDDGSVSFNNESERYVNHKVFYLAYSLAKYGQMMKVNFCIFSIVQPQLSPPENIPTPNKVTTNYQVEGCGGGGGFNNELHCKFF